MSKVRILLQILVIVVIALIEARKGEVRTPRDEENKPIKSFRNENGGIIDCFDIQRQPALNNPLLTNHKIQMEPSSIPGNFLNRNFETTNTAILKTVDCPLGTVPIQRTSQQHVKKSRHHIPSVVHGDAKNAPVFHYAYITAKDYSSIPFYGVNSWISVYHLNVLFGQDSESSIRVENNVNRDNIQFGWNVDPELYGDNETHVFGYWTADATQTTGCYNTQCPGFVQINNTRPLGAQILPVSTIGGNNYFLGSLVFMDLQTKNWWLVLEEGGNYVYVGYWPASLFTGLASHATDVFLGGAIYSSITDPPPPMGSGVFEPDDYLRTCYIASINFVNESNQLVEPVNFPMESNTDVPNCYKVQYKGNIGGNHSYTMVFGGPGGLECYK